MSNLFLSDTQFGSLFFKNIYEFFEEPRFFSVSNEVGGLFVVYWIGDDDDYDKWFIIPISKGRLEHLERKRIDIHAVLSYQEQRSYYQVNIPYDDSEEPEYMARESQDIAATIKLPKPGLFISGVTPVLDTGKLGAEVQFSTHEIHIERSAKNSQVPLMLNGVSKVFEKFNDLYNSILEAVGEKDAMTPISGRPGSFALSFQAEKLEHFEPLLKGLNDLILYKRDIIPYIKKNNIDVQMIEALFQSVIETSTTMELKSNSTGELIFSLSKPNALIYINGLAKLASEFVGGYQVPQANIIEQVFKIVELKHRDKYLNLESTGLDERHIFYYIHAAKILGFLNANGSIAALGQQLAESSVESKLKIAARSFEASHCGWAWIMWSNAKNLKGVKAETAEEFLMEKCLSLSTTTIKRRASTLRQWCDAFQPVYQEF
ncbi:DUF6575 domain-containing protein [Serratia marcescens]|uniref:DUF6575 domain-containing protein n=1 Tax=Serratia marcescens TaxID=615 RepID=UPI0021783366|nr:DUF6575 domain-containing protein [Serratia marcescens]CAI1971458.1 Uncharacterised protein [Serratia marcescens]